jgi:hypothetical protein
MRSLYEIKDNRISPPRHYRHDEACVLKAYACSPRPLLFGHKIGDYTGAGLSVAAAFRGDDPFSRLAGNGT